MWTVGAAIAANADLVSKAAERTDDQETRELLRALSLATSREIVILGNAYRYCEVTSRSQARRSKAKIASVS